GDLAGNHDEAGAGERLAGNPAEWVLGQAGVQNRVGYLVGNLVGVTLGHRFTSKQKAVALCQINTSNTSIAWDPYNPSILPSDPAYGKAPKPSGENQPLKGEILHS